MSTDDKPIEFIFLGTGTSSSIPHVDCLTSPPDGRECKTCLSTLTPEGNKNIRRNTSAIIRMNSPRDGREVTIAIDAGKTFQAGAIEWFPKYGLRRIDALLLTHPHADAMNGLDDLRGWTLGKRIQDHIDIYCSAFTFTEVQRCFPYLVSKEFASGGGDVPEFKWHLIDEKVPFEIEDTGIMVTPFSVHHGRVFSAPPCPSATSTPQTMPSTPTTQITQSMLKASIDGLQNRTIASLKEKTKKKEEIEPYYCLGFKIQKDIVYISDTSLIPEDAWEVILPPKGEKLPLFILDTLHIRPHISHFGIAAAVEALRRMGATRSYILGFSHDVSHEEWTRMMEVVSAGKTLGATEQWLDDMTESEEDGLKLVMQAEGENVPVWTRPAFDGLRIWIDRQGNVSDEFY